MRILGIDTAGPIASAALVEEGVLVAEASHGSAGNGRIASSPALKGNHAEILLPLIQTILAKSNCRVDEISGVGVSIGPGSFTGLRIGLATVKGLAYECGLAVVGVSTLLANAALAKDFRGLICAMLDARKREVYIALFQGDGKRLTRLTEDSIASLQGAVELVQTCRGGIGDSVLLVGDGIKAYEKFLIDALQPTVVIATGHTSVAAEVAALAEERFRRRLSDDLGALAPVYLRPSEAESKMS
jgi:tRNA threonylcarbamoyladenosine biosynthesis protein TsaB